MSSIPPDIPSWADVKIFSSAGEYTWIKPAWAKMVYYNIMSAGNGGGGGASRTSGQGGGGSGGSVGNSISGVNPAPFFPNKLQVWIGAGGTAGTAGNTGGTGFGALVGVHRTPTGVREAFRLWTGQVGGPGGGGTVSAGGTTPTTNSANNTSRVGSFGLCMGHSTESGGAAGNATGSATLLTASNSTQIQNGGGGGAGVSSTGYVGMGGGFQPQVAQTSTLSEANITTQFLRGGHGASVTLKGYGISNNPDASLNNTATVTFEAGETVIIAIGTATSRSTNVYTTNVQDGTHTYTPITSFVTNSGALGGEGSIQLYKADNVTAGTYNISATILSNGVQVGTNYLAWYRYNGLISGPVLASAVNSQEGTGLVFTDGITCGPLSTTNAPCLLFAATSGQNSSQFSSRVEPGSSLTKLIEPTNLPNTGSRVWAGDALVTTTDPITAQFTVFDRFTWRTTAAVLIGVNTNQLEPKAGKGADGTIVWLPDTIVPLLSGGAGGGSSNFTEGGDGGDGAPCCSGGGGGAGNPGGKGGKGGDAMVIIACW